MTEKDVKELPKGMMLVTYFLMLLGGGWLTWSSWRRIWPAHERSARVERTIDIAPTVGARPQRVMGRAGKPAFGHR